MKKLKKKFDSIVQNFSLQKKNISRLWNVDIETAELLGFLVLLKKPNIVVELGTSNGFSTFHLALGLKVKIITIDVEKARQDLAIENLGNFQNIEFISDRIENYLPKIDYSIDFLFIDANKTNYLNYLQLIEKHLSSNAVVVADNIDSHTGAIDLYKEYVINSDKYITIHLSLDNGLLISLCKG